MMDRIEAAFKSQRQFVTDASHELRTPLTVIIGELEFVQQQLQDEKQLAGIDTALAELDRLTRLVDQLLTLARIDARKLELERGTVRLDELVTDCVRLLYHEAARRGIQIDLHVEQAVEVFADPVRLKSVIINLLENALRYSPRGGSVSVSLQTPANGYVQLQVSDTGPGIAPDDRPKVFDRFFRTSEARASTEGSGLGLAIARELVDLHGGRITLQESTGGASFTVELPLP
jgi:signal transduction histidine kinase